ncbi:MAG: hypothetical protein JNG89_07445, partial [Planctomycetaceae bacterium]|nr:hypothetical protein [Planctomycetaceae bacterium]
MSLVAYRFRVFALTAIGLMTGLMSSSQAQEAAPEQEFIAILQSDGPEADKALACKKLAVVGSEAAVPELAKLLTNERLASWARIALEAIPGPAADEALRSATGSLDGLLLVGVVNSIGVRRDAGAVEVLSSLMDHQDALIASSASVALGRIGNEAATVKLLASLPGARPEVRSAVAEACVLCAERALAAGNSAGATTIYDQVRVADVPKQR